MGKSHANHNTHHWCSRCRKWILKKDAVDRKNGLTCPLCMEKGRNTRLRTGSRAARSHQSAEQAKWVYAEPRVAPE